MARYDQDPNFAGAFPTGQDFNAHDSAYPGAGSTGITPHEHSGATLGTASGSSVVGPGANASRMPQLDQPVGQGDSNSFSDGIAAHSSEIDGHAGDGGGYLDSGAGHGSDIPSHNPSSMWNRS